MPRLTVSLSDEQYEWIDSEATERDRTKSWVLRETVDAVRGVDSAFTSSMGDDDTSNHQSASPFTSDEFEEILDRLERLEERLDECPPRALSTAPVHEDGPSVASEGEGERAPSARSESERGDTTPGEDHGEGVQAGSHRRESAAVSEHDVPSVAADVLGDWTPNADQARDERVVQESMRAAAWLADVGGHQKPEAFREALTPDNLSERVWWERYALPGLNRLIEAGVVERRAGHWDYRWVGGG